MRFSRNGSIERTEAVARSHSNESALCNPSVRRRRATMATIRARRSRSMTSAWRADACTNNMRRSKVWVFCTAV